MMRKQILYLFIILTQFFLDMNNGRLKKLADSFETRERTFGIFFILSTYSPSSFVYSVRRKYQFTTSRITGVSPVSVLLGSIRLEGIY